MPDAEKKFERVNQKARTRMELLRAAGELTAQGKQPSVAEVADHAGISRATAYRYFSAPEDLIREAVLDEISRRVQPRVQALADGARDLDERTMPDALGDLIKQVFAMVSENEAMFRAMLVSSVTSADAKRGGRRLVWLDQVLAPLKKTLADADYKRLLYTLSLLTGIETLVVLKDVCGLENEAAKDVMLWAADRLLAGIKTG